MQGFSPLLELPLEARHKLQRLGDDNMKKLALVLLLVAGLAAPAFAGPIQVGYATGPNTHSSFGPYQVGAGGEFTLNPLGGWLDVADYADVAKNIGVAGTFQTFCIEGGEDIDGFDTVYDAEVNQNAVGGGVADPLGDPVSIGTGLLYSRFATGNLEGYNYSGTIAQRKASASQLQSAFWWLEGEKNVAYDANNPFMKLVADTWADPMIDGGWVYSVYALNQWVPGTDTGAQDTLWYNVPDGGATLMLLGGAFVGLAALRRKFRG
jgi:hypothetical protein